MGAIVAIAVIVAATMSQAEIPAKFDMKPCDAQTGCMHPAFK